MTGLRSLLFNLVAFLWTALLAIAYLPLLGLPRRCMQAGARLWIRGVMLLVASICGLRYRILDGERIPHGPALLAVKHQSAWDTLIFHLLCDDPVYVLKRELTYIPLFGWYLRKAGNIGIDRSAGATSLRAMFPKVKQRLNEGCQVIVFPEGTRTPPGTRQPYQPGIAALYPRFAVPLLPVALNSGLFWGRRRFRKLPGRITLEVLQPLPAGLDRRLLLQELEARIEAATMRLCTGGAADTEAGEATAATPKTGGAET